MTWRMSIVVGMLMMLVIEMSNRVACAQSPDVLQDAIESDWQQAETYRAQGRYPEAAQRYKKSATAEQKQAEPRTGHVINAFQ
jgi:hypothetical protein